MTTSFPYMKIAKEFDLPYTVVVLYADMLHQYGSNPWRAWAVDELNRLLPDEIHFKHFARAMTSAAKRRQPT
jgi:hypothetical protein